MTRLRYLKIAPNILHSKTNLLLSNGVSISVEINIDTNTYKFIDSDGNTISTGSGTSIVSVKNLVKKSLLAAGIVFEKEVRKSKNKNTEVAA